MAVPLVGEAQSTDDADPRFVGVLDVSDRYREFGYWGESNLYAEAPAEQFAFSKMPPVSSSPDQAIEYLMLVPTDFELIETSYEYKTVAVSAKMQDWVRVSINEEQGWIQMGSNDSFSAYLNLIEGQLAFAFSNQLNVADQAGGETRKLEITPEMQGVSTPHSSWPPDIEVLDTASLSDTLGEEDWIKIRIPKTSYCENYDGNTDVIFEGWVPAYDPDGEISVWYSPRGC